MDINQVYGLQGKQIIDPICAVDNLFNRQLINLCVESVKNLKAVSFILRDKAQYRGEVQQKGIRPEDKSVIDICRLTPLVYRDNFRTLLEEVAWYRAESLGLNKQDPDFWRNNARMLMADYLLASSLCYVEVFGGVQVDKFFATRNRHIAGFITGMSPQQTEKFTSYLQTYGNHYINKQFKVLKIVPNRNSFRIMQPKGYLDLNRSVKITPLFFMTTFIEGIFELLNKYIIRFKYIKDNLTEREFVSTLNPEILLKHYDQSFVQKMISNTQSMLWRGFVRLPELGVSRYDETGVRALNVSRITSIEIVQDFDTRFIDVDFSVILPTFKETIDSIRNPQILAMIYEDLLGKPPQFSSIAELQFAINSYVEGQYAIGTTTALRYLHVYMMQRPQIFKNYNGGKRPEFVGTGFQHSFNLGGEEA